MTNPPEFITRRTKSRERRWSARIVLRYALFQLPELVLIFLILVWIRRWVDFPTWISWVIIIAWIGKDMALFPFLWRAYDWDRPGEVSSMVGRRGITRERLAPLGYVRVGEELWQAEIMPQSAPIEKGEWVWVTAVEGIRLVVEPDNKENTGKARPSGCGER